MADPQDSETDSVIKITLTSLTILGLEMHAFSSIVSVSFKEKAADYPSTGSLHV